MCFVRLEHFTCVLLFFSMLHSVPLGLVTITGSVPLNSSEEIKNIFSNISDTNTNSEPVLKGLLNSGNFAEGGQVNVNGMYGNLSTSTAKAINVTDSDKVQLKKENTLHNQSSNVVEIKNHDSSKPLDDKNQILMKLNETGSNLFLGVPEVVHINGTSSIKPRKGVYYNKIVPRKGVDNESEGSDFSSEIHSCFWMNDNECYSLEDVQDMECSCCERGNSLGKKIKEQSLHSCKNCKQVNHTLTEEKHPCKNICCSKKSAMNETYSVSTPIDILDDYLNYKNHDKHNVSTSTEKLKITKSSSEAKKTVTVAEIQKNSTKILAKKPTVTKVPYDVESVTEILSKAKQKVFVPVLVSIFLLPLIGVLLFFFWRRTKEYWDKRYYKKMDFLIDGIYND